jgi:nucleotide-binding universal stress UspA family protein
MAVDPLKDVGSFLVPVDGTEAAYSALAVVCDVARQTKAQVNALYVIEVPRSLPLESEMPDAAMRGERILERAEAVGHEHKVSVDAELLQARQAGHAVVDEAVDRGVDAIVVGLDYHRPYGRFELGRLPQYVMEHSPAQVWLLRYPDVETSAGARQKRGQATGG